MSTRGGGHTLTLLSTTAGQFRTKMRSVNAYLKRCQVPHELAHRVLSFYEHAHSIGLESARGAPAPLHDLPQILRCQVRSVVMQGHIEAVPIFFGASPDLKRAVLVNLEETFAFPEDLLFRQGDIGTAMYFVIKGSVR